MADIVGGDRVNVGFPILKMEETDDGNLTVWGRATDASLDSDEQICDSAWSGKAMEDWLKTGANVRVMHSASLYPAGKGIELATSEDDGHFIKALIVEPTAIRLTKAGVLQAFSIGISQPKTVRDLKAKNGRIVGGNIVEVSLVDRPANASCGFTMVKSAAGAIVDADELFGDLEAALAAAEERVDAAIPEVDGFMADIEAANKAADDALMAWSAERLEFLASMPDNPLTPEWATWKADKDLLFTGDNAVRTWAYKRNMDPNVGGGVDRDKVPAEDFAGPNRTYPIVTPGDVADAASLVGHADDPDAVKRNIVHIANRKGKDFVAALPDSWKKGSAGPAGPSADASKSTDEPEATKGQKDCSNCGQSYDADTNQRNCENCGNKLPLVSDGDDDGKSVEAETIEVEVPEVEKSEENPELPYSLKRLHDITCGVYSDGALTREYASLKSWGDAINVEAVRAYSGDEMADVAAALKAVDPDMLADARAQLHKQFADRYPNNKGMSPGSITPGQFNRGYISADHQRQNASGGDSGAKIPSANVISPDQFDRGYITDGEARQSPGSSTSQKSSGPADTSAYTANFTRNNLENIHDHYSERRPEICAFAQGGAGVPADMHGGAVATPVTNAVADSSPAKNITAEYVKALVDNAMLEKSAKYEEKISALEKMVDELGAQPDPTQAPVRGVVAKLAGSGLLTPAEKELTTEREPTELEQLVAYIKKSRLLQSGDPNERMLAEAALQKVAELAKD